MQVSATLIAAQQAAREARARLQMPQQGVQQASAPNFAAALGKTTGVDARFSALPLKQVGAPATQAAPAAPQQAGARLGMHIDITV